MKQSDRWQDQRTILQEFDYYIDTTLGAVINKNSNLLTAMDKKSDFIKMVRRAFVAGAASTLANITDVIDSDDPEQVINYVRSFHRQLDDFVDKLNSDF